MTAPVPSPGALEGPGQPVGGTLEQLFSAEDEPPGQGERNDAAPGSAAPDRERPGRFEEES